MEVPYNKNQHNVKLNFNNDNSQDQSLNQPQYIPVNHPHDPPQYYEQEYVKEPIPFPQPAQYLEDLNADQDTPLMVVHRTMQARLNNIDKEYSSGKYKCIYHWMWFNLLVGVLYAISSILSGAAEDSEGQIDMLPYTLLTSWMVFQYIAEIVAIKKKSLPWSTLAMVLFLLNSGIPIFIEVKIYEVSTSFQENQIIRYSDDELDTIAQYVSTTFLVFGGFAVIFQILINLPISIMVWKSLRSRLNLEIEVRSQSIAN